MLMPENLQRCVCYQRRRVIAQSFESLAAGYKASNEAKDDVGACSKDNKIIEYGQVQHQMQRPVVLLPDVRISS